MTGLEISKAFYEEYGKQMIEENFPELASKIAIGVVGEGSDCLGFDDEISRDHDFEPGFCMFVSREVEREYGFKLSRAYSKLPSEYMGIERAKMSPVGGNRRGVIIIDEFYEKFLGSSNAPESLEQWMFIPSEMLLSASNGEIWRDDLGEFSKTREILKSGYPEDVRLKKMAAHMVLAGQAGQYNYDRLLQRGEFGAAQLAVNEFVKHTISVCYLINKKYEPFYKWAFRGMRDFEVLSELEQMLLFLLEKDNSEENQMDKLNTIEEISAYIIRELKIQELTDATCNNLETHGYSVVDRIKDSNLRNIHIMEGA